MPPSSALHPLPPGVRERLLAASVFCSGGIALVLEQVCEKYLSALVGSSRSASTIVLAVYFTGLALGAWLCPKKNAGAPRRLVALEGFIATWAVVVGLAFFAADRQLGDWLASAGSSALTLAAARLAIALLWILPPTLAMGAQLPTLAAVLASHPVGRGRSITQYYTLNLAGACAFTILTPPLLFNTVGADGALWTVAALGFGVSLVLVLAFALRVPVPTLAELSTPLPSPPSSPLRHSRLIAGAFAAGFGFFALEVIWFHLISAVSGASAYTFSILLAVVLLGLALGGRAAARQTTSLAPVLGWLVVALAISNALWPWAGPLMARVAATQQVESFWAGELVKFGVTAFIALPSAALAGQVFPRLLRRADTAGEPGRTVGVLCAANVVGCIAGALAAGFGLIPGFGAERALQGLALLAAAGWLALVLRAPLRLEVLTPGLTGLVLLALLPGWDLLRLTSGHAVYLKESPLPADSQLASFREDFATGFVTVIEHPQKDESVPVRVLLQNGKFDADDAGQMRAQIGLGLVAALHARATNRALVIGCGSGQTLSLIARLGFEHVDLAELSPAHLAAARGQFAHINADVLDRPGVRVHVEDGRNHLLRTRERFDAIQIELTSVWFAGATNLYSREFYALARSRLAPGGVLVQWIQFHHLTPREIASILASAQAEFPFVCVWLVDSQACFLASDQPPALNPAMWERWRNDPALAAERRITGPPILDEFRATELVSADRLPALLAATPTVLNTDRNRWLEFQTPKYALDRRDLPAINLNWFRSGPENDPSRVGVVAPALPR